MLAAGLLIVTSRAGPKVLPDPCAVTEQVSPGTAESGLRSWQLAAVSACVNWQRLDHVLKGRSRRVRRMK